jgi:acyl-CoA thioesterase YciA
VGSRPHGPGWGYRGRRTHTVAIDATTFIKAVQVGDVLDVYTEVESVGHASIKIHIEAWAQRIQTYERDKVANATFTSVHVGEVAARVRCPR